MAADDPQKKVGKRAYSAIGSRLIAIRELAQLVERHPYKVDVVGSSPAFPTKLQKTFESASLLPPSLVPRTFHVRLRARSSRLAYSNFMEFAGRKP